MEFDDIDEGKYYEIKEVYYNRDGSLMGYCDATVSGGTFAEVIGVLDMMREDAHKSVLKPSDFEGDSSAKGEELNRKADEVWKRATGEVE
jgi:hypothetical protein